MSFPTITGFKLSSQQRQIWWQQSKLGKTALTAQCTLTLRGDLDLPQLQASLQTVVNHHEILRTAFRAAPGLTLPLQVIEAQSGITWQQVDLRTVSAVEQTAVMAQWQGAERGQIQALEQACVRAVLFSLGAHWHQLLLTLPALCADAQTYPILLGQLSQSYGGNTSWLEDDLVQYAQFVTWQDQLLSETDDDARTAQAFWQQQDLPSLRPLSPPF
ncbi:MAG: condensation domain-containing protein, partial [Cyanobacteria bacterium J06659_2]